MQIICEQIYLISRWVRVDLEIIVMKGYFSHPQSPRNGTSLPDAV